MTPYELDIHVHDYLDKQKREYVQKVNLIYLGAYWQRIEKLGPNDLKKMLDLEEKPKEQTAESMLEEIKRLNAAFGGTTY